MQAEEIEEVKQAIKEAEAQQEALKKEDAKQTAAGTKVRNEVKRLEVVLANIELKRDEILKKAQLEEVSVRPSFNQMKAICRRLRGGCYVRVLKASAA